jgi:glycosyltransferase involved in cell wall biosynthesis
MKFSVLIAAYRAAPYLPAALATLALQTDRDWELVVVEDGSRDGTEAIVRSFAARHPSHHVVYDNPGENHGVAATRNRLLTLAQGDLIAFLDSDDEWQPTHLADLATALADGAALAISGIEIWDGNHQVSLGYHVPNPKWLVAPRLALFQHSYIQTSSCVALPRALAQRTGSFDETLHIGEDRDYWLRALAGGGRLVCTGHFTCRYTKHAGSSMTKTARVASDAVAFYRKYRADPTIPNSIRRRQLAEALWVQGRLTRQSDRGLARKLFRSAVLSWPFAPRYWIHLIGA